MLGELYRYAVDHELAARPGFKQKRPQAYLLLSADGGFLGVDHCEKDAPGVMAPDIGAAARGTRYCNILIEKASITLGIVTDPEKDVNIPTKHVPSRGHDLKLCKAEWVRVVIDVPSRGHDLKL